MHPQRILDKFEAFIDLQKFGRKLGIQKHFATTEGTCTVVPPSKHTYSGLHN